MGMSQKHLIAQFNQLVGGTPKLVARLYRFRHILSTIDPTRLLIDVGRTKPCITISRISSEISKYHRHNPTDYLQLRRRVQTERPNTRPISTGCQTLNFYNPPACPAYHESGPISQQRRGLQCLSNRSKSIYRKKFSMIQTPAWQHTLAR
jgi:hypothetical protein